MGKKRKAFNFSVGQHVVYPAHGVGKIVAIERESVAGVELEMFVVFIEKDKLTLRIPTSKATAIGMRSLATPELAQEALNTLKGKAVVKRLMWSRRAQEYDQKINSGDIIQISEVVRDLHRKDEQREQSYSERQLYESAVNRLTREIAAVKSQSEETANADILKILNNRKK